MARMVGTRKRQWPTGADWSIQFLWEFDWMSKKWILKKKQVETHEKMRSKEHIYESFSIICSHHLKILWLSPKKMMFQTTQFSHRLQGFHRWWKIGAWQRPILRILGDPIFEVFTIICTYYSTNTEMRVYIYIYVYTYIYIYAYVYIYIYICAYIYVYIYAYICIYIYIHTYPCVCLNLEITLCWTFANRIVQESHHSPVPFQSSTSMSLRRHPHPDS